MWKNSNKKNVCVQSESLVVCEVDEDLVKKLRDFRFRKETNNAAIISELNLNETLKLVHMLTLTHIPWGLNVDIAVFSSGYSEDW